MSDEIKLTLEPFDGENKQELDSAVAAAVQATEALEQAEQTAQKEVQQAVIKEACLEIVYAAAAHAVEQVVVDVVNLQRTERVLVHLL